MYTQVYVLMVDTCGEPAGRPLLSGIMHLMPLASTASPMRHMNWRQAKQHPGQACKPQTTATRSPLERSHLETVLERQRVHLVEPIRGKRHTIRCVHVRKTGHREVELARVEVPRGI